MGKQSTRENKTIYQLCREAAGLTRAEASDKMKAVSDSKIEKFEYETQEPTPYDIIQMADAYKRPDLCNYYCSHKCEIGHRYVLEVEVTDLSNIILETIAGLNEINPLTSRLIQIARDGKISDDEMRDFAFISKKLDEISLAIDALTFYECDVTSPIIPPIINSGKAIYINPPTTIPINITGKKITVQSNFMNSP